MAALLRVRVRVRPSASRNTTLKNATDLIHTVHLILNDFASNEENDQKIKTILINY